MSVCGGTTVYFAPIGNSNHLLIDLTGDTITGSQRGRRGSGSADGCPGDLNPPGGGVWYYNAEIFNNFHVGAAVELLLGSASYPAGTVRITTPVVTWNQSK